MRVKFFFLSSAPLNGHWNRWGAWGSCSVTCDSGAQIRKRDCTDPTPKNGGKSCQGSSSSSQKCEKRSCTAGLFSFLQRFTAAALV